MCSFSDKLIELAANIYKSKTMPKKLRECCSVTAGMQTRMATALRLKTQMRMYLLGKKLWALALPSMNWNTRIKPHYAKKNIPKLSLCILGGRNFFFVP